MTSTDIGGVMVSGATVARLQRHLDDLLRWNSAINLVARSTLADAWTRHVIDSAQLVALAPDQPQHWADLGSGAGFPGLVVAAILAECAPLCRITLVESDQRKAAFLRETARRLDLPTTVLAARIETVAPLAADVISARALAPVDRLLPLALPHLAPGGICLFPKGGRADEELALARRAWSFSVERLSSRTDPAAEILRLKGLHHV